MTYALEISSSESYDYKDSTKGSSSSSHRKKRKMYSNNNLDAEFRKDKPPTFDGEIKYGQ